jgi:protein-tyrosine phosphatase
MERALIIHPTIQYEERDTYQDIIQEKRKHIFLGNIQSRKCVVQEKIEWVIEILSKNEYGLPLPNDVRIYRYEFEDNRHIDISKWLEEILPIIHNETGNGLIHCREGRSRSATILIAYIMKYYNKSYDDALEYVRSKRSVVKPNPGFERQLRMMQFK